MNYWIFTHFSTSIYVSLFRDGGPLFDLQAGKVAGGS